MAAQESPTSPVGNALWTVASIQGPLPFGIIAFVSSFAQRLSFEYLTNPSVSLYSLTQTKFGHVQVPIGWSENPQLANWVSKQRQEYKNLLRGRTTRLDETRIQLLNGVEFAWQLQRGGRRRQLKARKRETTTVPGGAADGHASSDGSAGSNQDDDGGDNDGSCILPGEVLIGQGAPTSGEHENVFGRTYSTKDPMARNTMKKGGNQGKAVAMPQGLGTPPMNQPRMQQPLHSSLFTSSQLGLPISPRGATAVGGAVNAHHHQILPRNNDLHDLVLARNALYNNLQRQSMAGSAQGSPLLQQGFGMAGTFPNFDLQQSQQILAARAGLQAQAQNQYQQQQVSNRANRLLQASMQRQLSNFDASLGLSTGNATHAMANAPGPNPNMIAMLESAPGMHTGRRGTMEESKLSSDGVQPQAQQNQQLNLQNLNLQLLQQQFQQQQQQQQQQLQQHQQGRGGPSGGEQSGQQGSNRGFGGFFGGGNLS